MDVSVFLEPKLDLTRIAELLDGLGHEGRLHTVGTWSKKQQAAIFEAAKGVRPLTLEHLVPADTEPLVQVIHDGRNTLPVFSRFQKRFCKPDDDKAKDVLWGYNHGVTMPYTGPGYFVAKAGDEGELVIDYRELPPSHPASWPPILPNSARLGMFVYEGMVDYLRGISEHVSIGRAWKKGEMMDAWFVLVRQDPA